MLTCPPEQHSTYKILTQAGVDLNGKDVIQAGAHDCIERETFFKMGVSKVNAFECNPFVFPDLLERFKGTNWKAYQTCLWSKPHEKKQFYFYRNKKDGAGGLFKADRMNEFVDCKETGETITVTTNTLNSYIDDGIIDISNTSFLMCDLQGSELEVLKGGTLLLISSALKYILCECSTFACYKDAPQLEEIVEYLKGFGFEPKLWYKDWGNDICAHGDILFIR